MEIEAEKETRTRRRSLWIAASVTALALAAIGVGLWFVVDWLKPPPVEAPPEELRAEPGLQRFVPHGPRSLLSRHSPKSDVEEPPAVPLDHPFAKTRITGRVYDLATGDGILGASVRVKPTFGVPRLGAEQGDGSVVFTTQRDGSYAMKGIPPGTFDMEIQAPGYAPAKSGFKKFSAVEDDDGFDVGLSRGGALEGRVLTADRRPVAGARVTASAGSAVMLHEQSLVATTGEDGRFILDPVEARELHVYATHPRLGSKLQVVPASEDPSREVEVVLDAGRTLRGRVRDADGPVAGARVMIGLQRLEERIVSAAPSTAGLSVTTGSDGAFELQVPTDGPIVILAEASGYETGSVLITEATDPPGGVEVLLQRATEFAGVVVGSDGRPAMKAEVTILSLANRRQRMPLQAWTGEDGTFRIEGVSRQGPYRVMINHHAHPPLTTNETEVRTNHRYQLEAEGKILGNILDAASGGPVTRYDYGVSGPAHREAGAVSLSGAFEVDQLPAGTYALNVQAEGYEPATLEGIVVSPGQIVQNVVVRLKPAGSIVGRVRGAHGEGMIVVAMDAEAHTEAQAPVAEDGAFSIGDLPSGRYSLLAVGENDEGALRGQVDGITVESGRATRDIEIPVRVVGPRETEPDDPQF